MVMVCAVVLNRVLVSVAVQVMVWTPTEKASGASSVIMASRSPEVAVP